MIIFMDFKPLHLQQIIRFNYLSSHEEAQPTIYWFFLLQQLNWSGILSCIVIIERIFLFAHSIPPTLIPFKLLHNCSGMDSIYFPHCHRSSEANGIAMKYFFNYSTNLWMNWASSYYSRQFFFSLLLLYTHRPESCQQRIFYATITMETKMSTLLFIKSNSYSSPTSRRKAEKALVEN